jgi:hypothetical protein
MEQHSNEMFSNQRIDLDNASYLGCAFDRCQIVFSGVGTYELKNCIFDHCSFSFDGPALQTIRFLTDMYRVGPELFEPVLTGIRNGVRI